MSDGLVTVTVTPGITPCVASVTRPLIAPVPEDTAWPYDDDANPVTSSSAKLTTHRPIESSLDE
jgi:hypothetical protein